MRYTGRVASEPIEPLRDLNEQIISALAEPLRAMAAVAASVQQAMSTFTAHVPKALGVVSRAIDAVMRASPRPLGRGAVAELLRFMKGRPQVAPPGRTRRRAGRIGRLLLRLGRTVLETFVPESIIVKLRRLRRRHRREAKAGHLPAAPRLIQLRVPASEIATTIMRHGPPVQFAPTHPAVAS